jgi:hypothetical protein
MSPPSLKVIFFQNFDPERAGCKEIPGLTLTLNFHIFATENPFVPFAYKSLE